MNASEICTDLTLDPPGLEIGREIQAVTRDVRVLSHLRYHGVKCVPMLLCTVSNGRSPGLKVSFFSATAKQSGGK